MSQKIPLYYALSTIILSTLLVATIIYAWTEPTVVPPGGNVSASINVGGDSQYKSGALGIGGVFRGYSNGIFDGNVGIGTASPNQKLEVASGIIRVKKTAGTAGSVDMFVAVGDATSRTGTALCESSLGANDVDAVCLGHWTSALVESTCATSLANSRVLCVIVGD